MPKIKLIKIIKKMREKKKLGTNLKIFRATPKS